MTNFLNYSPGQTATIYQEVIDGYTGARVSDGYVPVVQQIIGPNFIPLVGYPQTMTQIDAGLFYFQFTIPSGASSVGTFLVDIAYLNPVNMMVNNETYQVIVNAPYGNYGITTF